MSLRIASFKNWYASITQQRKLEAAVIFFLGLGLILRNEVAFVLMFLFLFAHEGKSLRPAVKAIVLNNGNWLMIAVPIVLFFSVAAYRQPAAADDLLRNLVVWEYGYDYRRMFPDADIQSWSLWYGFDRSLGFLGQYLEPKFVMWMVEAAAAVLMLAVLYIAGSQILADREGGIFWVAAITWLAFTLSLPRIVAGRPEIFMAIWLIAAMILRRPIDYIVWLISGVALSSAYWLAFLYFPAVALLRSNMRIQLAIGIFLSIFHFIFWQWISGGEYFNALLWQKQALGKELASISVGENLTLVLAFLVPIFSLLSFMALYGTWTTSRKPWPLIVIVIYFFLSNQLRYIATLAPLLAILNWNVWGDRLPQLGFAGRVALLASTIAAVSLCFRFDTLSELPAFKLPAGAKVITRFGAATYSVVFHNPGKVQTAPSYAFGSSPVEIQQISTSILRGTIDCDMVKRWGYSHIVEDTFVGKPPMCLHLLETQREWRLWGVNR